MKNCQTCTMLVEMMAKHDKEAHTKKENEKIKALECEDKE